MIKAHFAQLSLRGNMAAVDDTRVEKLITTTRKQHWYSYINESKTQEERTTISKVGGSWSKQSKPWLLFIESSPKVANLGNEINKSFKLVPVIYLWGRFISWCVQSAFIFSSFIQWLTPNITIVKFASTRLTIDENVETKGDAWWQLSFSQ